MNVLFVCSRNRWRSPTAERIYQNVPGVTVRSAGTSEHSRRCVSQRDVEWADLVLVMEHKHKERLQSQFRVLLQMTPVHVLDIPDEFGFMDATLVQLLREAIGPILVRT